MYSPTFPDFLLLFGLLVEISGVYLLVRTSDIGFNFLLKHVGRLVPDDFEDQVKRVHRRNKIRTVIGIMILTAGILMQYFGILSEKIFS